jgi:FtsP/CotA-like multicopper oxidase with cupredoxin domain
VREVKGDTTVPSLLYADDIVLGPAARTQIIVPAPGPNVRKAMLVTLDIDTGPLGDNDPYRPIASIQLYASATTPTMIFPSNTQNDTSIIFGPNPADVLPIRNRTLYFSEVVQDPSNSNSPTTFYLTEAPADPVAFYAAEPAMLETWQGDIENWIVQNRASESHVFHSHQLHFTLLESYNIIEEQFPLNQFLDTVVIPYWNGTGDYPAYLMQLNFTSVDIGEFIVHCHIAAHEDQGMILPVKVMQAGAS